MIKPPTWFTVTAIVALLWNLMGCLAFASDLQLTAEDVAKLPETQQALYKARPDWSVVATALAVIGGALGSLGLLLRRKWALPVLVVSLIGIVVQDYSLFVLADSVKLAGPVVVLLQGIVLAVGVGLVLLARKAIARGWLR